MEQLFGSALRPFWGAAHSIIVANELDGKMLVERAGVSPSKVQVLQATIISAATSLQWPRADAALLAPAAADAIRKRSHALSASGLLLARDTGTARPSLKGATVWLIRRVIGKTRGWVTKLLRP
jgi:hypothetical protein